MAGFLTALGGIGEMAGVAGQGLQGIQTIQQQNANRAAFNKALDGLGPEGEIFRQMRNAGASPEAIIPTMQGVVGQDIKEQYIQGQIQHIVNTPGLSDMDKAWQVYAITQDPSLLKDMMEVQRFQMTHHSPQEYRDIITTWLANPPAGVDEATKAWGRAVLASPNPAAAEEFWKAVGNKFYGGYWNEKLITVPEVTTNEKGETIIKEHHFGASRAGGGLGGARSVDQPPAGESSFAPGPRSSAAAPAASPDETGTPLATPSGTPTTGASALPSFVPPTPAGLPSGSTLPGAEETETPEELMSPAAIATPAGALTPGVPYTPGAPINPAVGTATPTPTPTPTPEPVMEVPPADPTLAATPEGTPTQLAQAGGGLRPGTKAGPGFAKQQIANRMVDAVTGAALAVKQAAAQLPGGLRDPMDSTRWSEYGQFSLGIPIEPHAAQFMALVSTLRRNAMQATVIVTGSSSMRAAARLQGIHIPQEQDAPQVVLEKLNTMQMPGGVIDLFNVEAGRMTEQQYFQRLSSGPLGPTDWRPTAGGLEYSPSLGVYRQQMGRGLNIGPAKPLPPGAMR